MDLDKIKSLGRLNDALSRLPLDDHENPIKHIKSLILKTNMA
jgi:hypothetical protein